MAVEQEELARRLVADEWMLRDIETAFEILGRRHPDSRDGLRERCKLCGEPVNLWERVKHLRVHTRARDAMRRKAQAKLQEQKLKNLARAREMRSA